MRGSVKVVKGRIEEAAGVLSNDDALRDKGRADRFEGEVKQAAELSVHQAKVKARKLVNKAKSAAKEVVDKAHGRD